MILILHNYKYFFKKKKKKIKYNKITDTSSIINDY